MATISGRITAQYGDFLIRPERWLGRQLTYFTSPLGNESNKVIEVIKRIILFVPFFLVFCLANIPATLGRLINLFVSHVVIIGKTTPIIQGSGVLETRSIDLSPYSFHTLVVNDGKIEIIRGDRASLSLTTDQNLLDLLEFHVQGTTLHLQNKTNCKLQPAAVPVSWKLTLSNHLTNLQVFKTADVTINHLEGPSFSCLIKDNGKVQIHNGRVDQQNVEISDKGIYKASDVEALDTYTQISGNGSAELQSRNTLDVSISGMGKCTYFGNPQIIKRMSGGHLIQRI